MAARDADLLTSTEAASLLGVSPSSIKRWAEEGVLACVKTAGKHRRFERGVIERFRGAAPVEASGRVADDWIDEMLRIDDVQALAGMLLEERARLGCWWRVAETLGGIITEIGARWVAGKLSILDEHLISERLLRALARVCDVIPLAASAPRALLAAAEGDDHSLGLALVELCLRELGWRTLWAGRQMPVAELVDHLGALKPQIRLLAVSASGASTDARSLQTQAQRLGVACREADVALALGGAGRWPEQLSYGTRLRSIEGLHAYAAGLLG